MATLPRRNVLAILMTVLCFDSAVERELTGWGEASTT